MKSTVVAAVVVAVVVVAVCCCCCCCIVEVQSVGRGEGRTGLRVRGLFAG